MSSITLRHGGKSFDRETIVNHVRLMPKVELHKHLEGSIRYSTLKEVYAHSHDLSQFRDDDALDEAVRNHFCVPSRIRSLTEFLDKFEHTQRILASTEMIERVTFEACEDAARQNVIVLELRYSPVYILRGHGDLTVRSIHDAVLAGVRRAEAAYPQMAVGLIGILDRCSNLDDATEAANFFISNKDTFVGVDLANDEEKFDGLHFAPLFERCRNAGLGITIHAGEVASPLAPTNVSIAIRNFGATRIGHGIHVLKDEETVIKAKGAGVVFEVCPTSNVLTGNATSLEGHPLRRLLDAGLRVTISTDDPGLFLLDLEQECVAAVCECGITLEELWLCQVEGYESSFLPKDRVDERWQRAVNAWRAAT